MFPQTAVAVGGGKLNLRTGRIEGGASSRFGGGTESAQRERQFRLLALQESLERVKEENEDKKRRMDEEAAAQKAALEQRQQEQLGKLLNQLSGGIKSPKVSTGVAQLQAAESRAIGTMQRFLENQARGNEEGLSLDEERNDILGDIRDIFKQNTEEFTGAV